MTKMFLLAGAAALAAAMPAAAKPGGNGNGQGKAKAGHMMHAQGKANKPAHAMKSGRSAMVMTRALDRNRNGILDADERLARKYGGALCPPGLAKKTPACVPPGQAKRIFSEGQRVPAQYRYFTPYSDIPVVLRDRYDLNDQYRYIYRNNVIYTVDPTTNLITSIINAVL